MMFGQDQKATVVGDQVQPIVVMAIPQGVPDLRQRAQVVMARHQALEARLLGRGDGLQDGLAQVQARVLGWWLLQHLIPALPGIVQS